MPFNACSLTCGHHLNAADPGGKGGMQGYEDNGFYDDMWAVESPKVLVGGWNGGGRGTRGGQSVVLAHRVEQTLTHSSTPLKSPLAP